MPPEGHIRRFVFAYFVVQSAIGLSFGALDAIGAAFVDWLLWIPRAAYFLLVFGATKWLTEHRRAVSISERWPLAAAYAVPSTLVDAVLWIAFALVEVLQHGDGDWLEPAASPMYIFAALFVLVAVTLFNALVARLAIGAAAGRALAAPPESSL